LFPCQRQRHYLGREQFDRAGNPIALWSLFQSNVTFVSSTFRWQPDTVAKMAMKLNTNIVEYDHLRCSTLSCQNMKRRYLISLASRAVHLNSPPRTVKAIYPPSRIVHDRLAFLFQSGIETVILRMSCPICVNSISSLKDITASGEN
jgi:hypothetical protein